MSPLPTAGRDIRGVPAVGLPAFTGRDREVAALAAVLAAGPAVVIVEGEAGIGKTRLIREYLATPVGKAQEALVACCPPLARPQTHGPLADALRQALGDDGPRGLGLSALAGALRPLFPEWAADLPPAPEPAEDASAARYRVFAALAELLARMGVGLLVVEDVHWADEATLEFLLYLAARQPRPLSLVATCRPEDAPARPLLPRLSRLAAGTAGLRITLGPLDLAGTARLVSSMLAGERISEEFAVFMHQHTDGVPLAAEELVRLMTARADLARHGGEWVRRRMERIGIPATIRDAVLERAGRLGADGQAVLRAAAVLAEPADDALLTVIAGIAGGQLAGLCEALGCGLLDEDGRGLVSFRHALAARAVYEAIPAPQRRAMHRRAGEALEAEVPAAAIRLARHFREAGDTGRWCRYAEQAADAALAVGDEATAAVVLYDLVTEAGLPAYEAARLTNKIALVSFASSAPLRNLARALRVLADAGSLSPALEADVRFQLGRVLMATDVHDAARAELEKAVPGLAPGSVQMVRAMMLLGVPRGSTCRASEHLRWLRRAAKAAGSLEPAERLRLLIDHAEALLELNDQAGWAEASQIPSDASGPGDRLQVTRGHRNIGEVAVLWGCYREARLKLARAAELAAQYGYSRILDEAVVIQAYLDWLTGAWDGLPVRTGALAEDEDLQPMARMKANLVVGLMDAVVGNHDRAGDRLRHVLGELLGHGAVLDAVEPVAALARLALASGDSETTLKVTGEPTGIIARKGTWIWATDLAPARVEALAATGRYDDAEALVAAFACGLRGRNAPAPKAGLALCRAILAEARREHARAAGLFARAAAAWNTLPRPYDAWLARERQGRCLLAAGSAESAARLLTSTRQGLSDLGAARDADRVTRVLRDHGVAVPRVWRGGRRGYGSQLSPREREVVRLVACGRTNTEIAAELFRSPNTVAMQVKSALAKLGVSSRTALAVKAVELGIVPGGQPYGGDRKQPSAMDGQ